MNYAKCVIIASVVAILAVGYNAYYSLVERHNEGLVRQAYAMWLTSARFIVERVRTEGLRRLGPECRVSGTGLGWSELIGLGAKVINEFSITFTDEAGFTDDRRIQLGLAVNESVGIMNELTDQMRSIGANYHGTKAAISYFDDSSGQKYAKIRVTIEPLDMDGVRSQKPNAPSAQ